MSPISSLIITQVHSSPEYIFEIFRKKRIATIIRILLLPYSLILKNSQERGSLAIIDIHEWHDTETAYQFISQLNNGILVNLKHNNVSDSWIVARNLYNDLTKNINQQSYIAHFNVYSNQEYADDNEQWKGVNLESALELEI